MKKLSYQGDVTIAIMTPPAQWFHERRKAEDELIAAVDRELAGAADDQDQETQALAYQETLNLDGHVQTVDNYVTAYMKRLPRTHPLWKVYAIVGFENFLLLVRLFQSDAKRTVQFPAKSELFRAAADADILRMHEHDPKLKHTDIAAEIGQRYGIAVSASHVSEVLRAGRQNRCADADELNNLLRVLLAKHRALAE